MTKTPQPAPTSQPTPPKKSRQRSPNYPAIGLEKALERATAIKDQAGRHAMPVGVAFQAWNYKTAAGDQTVAALKAFGLIEVQGSKDKRQLKVTEAAWRILGNAPDRPELLKAAALKPEIHKKLWEKYPGLEISDAILSDYLKWELTFNASFVDSFITQFRATITFAGVSASDTVATVDSDQAESEETAMQQATQQTNAPIATSGTRPPADYRQMTELAFKLSRNSDAKIVIYGDATQEGIKKLQALLKLSEDAFPSGETSSEPEREAQP